MEAVHTPTHPRQSLAVMAEVEVEVLAELGRLAARSMELAVEEAVELSLVAGRGASPVLGRMARRVGC